MTIQDLFEVDVEIGKNKIFKVDNGLVSNKTHDKTSDISTVKKLVPAEKSIGPSSKAEIRKVIEYLRKTGKLEYIADLNNKTPDIQFLANGDAIVNFDKGGSIKIPSNYFNNKIFNY